ncbi:Hypp9505 [Branchiostoma lanceolatum]|uniref:Hypp9505 protein n=1 Tax=Branchiostoma lanceolatum TaxID=7740 RepID=A0A8S4MMY1_BRALA|nr:Hypp9505 [Branchiostoma lanceolatum]
MEEDIDEDDSEDDENVITDEEITASQAVNDQTMHMANIAVEASVFDQGKEKPRKRFTVSDAAVVAGQVESTRVEAMADMFGGMTGPHVASVVCSGAGKLRPWPLPMTPTTAQDVCRRERRLLIAVVDLTPEMENTSLARFTTTTEFHKLVNEETNTTRKPGIFIHIQPDDNDGKEFLRQYGVSGNFPALVAVIPPRRPIVVTTSEDGEMQNNRQVRMTAGDLLEAVGNLQ